MSEAKEMSQEARDVIREATTTEGRTPMTTTNRRPDDLHSRATEARLNAEAYARAYDAAACGPDAPFLVRTQSICPDVPAAELYEMPSTTRERVIMRALAVTCLT